MSKPSSRGPARPRKARQTDWVLIVCVTIVIVIAVYAIGTAP